MRLTSTLLAGLIAAAAGGGAAAQDVSRGKDFRQWSDKDCRKMLEDSPWARSFTYARTYVETLGASTRERELQMNPRFVYVVQIRSALPIRQALVRQKQLETNYDKTPPEQQKAFDQSVQEFLSRESPDVIIVYVIYSSNVMTYNRELARHWEALPPEIAMKQILLVPPRGRRIYPLTYTAIGGGGGAFQITFPKQINQEPILAPQDRQLKLEFPHPNIGDQGEAQVTVTFDLRKMTVDGKVLY
jgi:hypothetical protein